MSLGSVNGGQELANQKPWYVLLVKPRHEKSVTEALDGKGYEGHAHA